MIQEKQAEYQKVIVQGQALDYADYRDRAGYLRGLANVVSWMEKISMQDDDKEMRP